MSSKLNSLIRSKIRRLVVKSVDWIEREAMTQVFEFLHGPALAVDDRKSCLRCL